MGRSWNLFSEAPRIIPKQSLTVERLVGMTRLQDVSVDSSIKEAFTPVARRVINNIVISAIPNIHRLLV